MVLVLNTGFHARMGDVIVVADFTKRIAATFQSTVSTYCCSAVRWRQAYCTAFSCRYRWTQIQFGI